MKRWLVGLAVALLLGGLVGALASRDPGYVLLSYAGVAVETSLWFALLVLVAAYLLIRLLTGALRRIGRSPAELREWQERRRVRSAREQTGRGLLRLAEGRWAEARRLLTAAAPHAETPLVNHLQAARAAQRLGDDGAREQSLQAAAAAAPEARTAVGLTRAELQAEGGHWRDAVATLRALYRHDPRHPRVLGMLARGYGELGDWQALLELLPELKRHGELEADAREALERQAWRGRLADAGLGPARDPGAVWRQVPKAHRLDPAVAAAAARAFVAAGRPADAETVVRDALERHWDAELVGLYGRLPSEAPSRQRTVAEKWLKDHPDDADLLLALGRINLMNGDWAEARELFEASLRRDARPEAQAELGRLLLTHGDPARGRELLGQALDLPPLPSPPVVATPQRGLGA